MFIGLTYDLREDYLAEGYGETETAEFDRRDTIDALREALEALGHEVDCIGKARELIQRLAGGDRWDLVFNICEGLHGAARESQVPAILDVYDIPYTFSDPLVLSVCLQKNLTKMVVAQAQVPTAPFRVVRELNDVTDWDLEFPVFAKPIAEGTGKGVTPASRIDSRRQLLETCENLLQEFRQPVLVESYLSGREFTIGLVGTGAAARVLGTIEILLKPAAEAGVYSYVNKEFCEELVEYRHVHGSDDAEVARAEQIALQAWRALECRDAGRIDIRSDSAGVPHFIEANPLAGLHPQHSDLPMIATAVGMEFSELIGSIVESASQRIPVR